jgi:hypothetical protein
MCPFGHTEKAGGFHSESAEADIGYFLAATSVAGSFRFPPAARKQVHKSRQYVIMNR